VTALQARVTSLESERPGRKPKPLLAYKQRDVCGLDPSRDSSTCPDSSIYRYQSGCWGAACRLRQHEAYERRKGNKEPAKKAVAKRPVKAPVKAVAVKVKPPEKKTAAKRTSRPTKAPAKRVTRRTPTKQVAKAS